MKTERRTFMQSCRDTARTGSGTPVTGKSAERDRETVQVGDVVTRMPVTLGDPCRGIGNTTAPPMRGRVIYVHPEGRFHTVEFSDGHGPVRESFKGVRR